MSDVDAAGAPEMSARTPLRNLPTAIRTRLRSLNPMRSSEPAVSSGGGILADQATDELAAVVFGQLHKLPEEAILANPHQALMDLAARAAASKDYPAAAPTVAQLQAIIDELSPTERCALIAHVSGRNFRQVAQKFEIPAEVALRELKRAYSHLRMRLLSTPQAADQIGFSAPERARE